MSRTSWYNNDDSYVPWYIYVNDLTMLWLVPWYVTGITSWYPTIWSLATSLQFADPFNKFVVPFRAPKLYNQLVPYELVNQCGYISVGVVTCCNHGAMIIYCI